MTSIETKKNNPLGVEVDVETHKRITDLPDLLGIKNATIYKDIDFLGISTIKDNEGCAWISNEDFQGLLLLRKYIEINGRRTGFDEEKASQLVLAEKNNITNNKESEISEQNIYVEPEDPEENMDVDNIVRKGAELKAREIAMPHLVVRAIRRSLPLRDRRQIR